MFFIASGRQSPILKLGIIVGSFCGWVFIGMGIANAQTGPPTSTVQADGGEKHSVADDLTELRLEQLMTLRERERQMHAARTPIIALTANAMEGNRDLCLVARMDDHLRKPFSQQALAEMLARWCPPQDQLQPDASASAPPTTATVAAGGHSSAALPVPPLEHVDRTAWASIVAFQKSGQPDMLHKIIGLYLASSQAQVTQLRQAWQRREYDAVRGLAHSLKSSSATLGAHRLAPLAKQLEETCRTHQLEHADDLIVLIEVEHQLACVIVRQELTSSPKEGA